MKKDYQTKKGRLNKQNKKIDWLDVFTVVVITIWCVYATFQLIRYINF